MAQTRVKLCGLTRPQDAELGLSLGAWALGLIFYAGSPRRCSPAAAREISALSRRRLALCGVWVNAPLDEVIGTADGLGLSHVQLHGDEGPAYCAEVARRTGCRVIKAVAVRTRADLQALRAYPTDLHLLDAAAPGLRGGTGRSFDWKLASAHAGPIPVVLSGGLRSENVADGIRAVRPWAVDTASGTESAPGIKDAERVQRFFGAVAEADAEALDAAGAGTPARAETPA